MEKESILHPWSSLEFARLVDSGGVVLVALHGNAIVQGYLAGKIVYDEAELYKIAVGKDFRRKGIAQMLLLHLETMLRARGVKNLHLEVAHNNFHAVNFYMKQGFIVVGLRKNYYGPGIDGQLMQKKIV